MAETFTAEHRKQAANDPLGCSPAIWKQFAELGWLALPIAEAHGGLGGGAIEIGLLMEAFGRGLVSEPFLSTVVIGAALVAECGTEAQKQAILPKVAEGALTLAFAHSERAARFDLAHVDTTATKTADGWRLNGSKIAVLDGAAANQIIVSARIANANGASGKLALFLVPAGTPRRHLAATMHGSAAGAAAISISRMCSCPPTPCLATASDALPGIETVVDRAMAALGAEAVSIMQTLLDTTLEYTKIRKQFGRPLSANQVIRHRLADVAMQVDEARSMALRAALMANAEPVTRSRAASGAKAKIGKCARFVAEQAVQLHGAMGVTEELDIGAYFKRLLAFDTLFGGSAHHYRRHAALERPRPRVTESASWISPSAPKSAPSSRKSATIIASSLTPEMKRATALTPSVFSDPDIGMAWQRALHKKGWGAPGWPVDHGGPDWTPAQRWIFEAECARAGVPNVNVMGVKMVGPVIIGFGSPGAEEFLSAADSVRRGLLVPGLFRAGLRLRPRLAEDPRGARRRRLCHQRHQDLDHACASRQPHVRAGAHQ